MKDRDAVVCERESALEVMVHICIYPHHIQVKLCPSESLEFFFSGRQMRMDQC